MGMGSLNLSQVDLSFPELILVNSDSLSTGTKGIEQGAGLTELGQGLGGLLLNLLIVGLALLQLVEVLLELLTMA
jgi:hypothetical protein